jgi:hypothetical protein
MSSAWAGSQSRRQIFLMWVLCAGFWLVFSHPVRAQTARETAMARALFEEGVKLADEARWSEAVDRFERARALKPTPGITFNLASAMAETGKVIEASEMLETLARHPSTPPDLKRDCEAKITEIQARRAFLTVQVEAAPTEAHVSVDGHEWPRAAWGVMSPIDPGTHEVVGSENGEQVTRASLALGPGERRELKLSWPSSAVAEAPADPGQNGVEDAEDSDAKPLRKNWMLWTGVGLVVAGGVIATVLLTRPDSETQAPIPGSAGVITW